MKELQKGLGHKEEEVRHAEGDELEKGEADNGRSDLE